VTCALWAGLSHFGHLSSTVGWSEYSGQPFDPYELGSIIGFVSFGLDSLGHILNALAEPIHQGFTGIVNWIGFSGSPYNPHKVVSILCGQSEGFGIITF